MASAAAIAGVSSTGFSTSSTNVIWGRATTGFHRWQGLLGSGKHLAQNTSEHSVHWNPSPAHVLSHAAHSELSPPISSRYGPRTSRNLCPKTRSAGDTTIKRSGLGSKTVSTSLTESNCQRSCSMRLQRPPVCQISVRVPMTLLQFTNKTYNEIKINKK